MTHLIMDEIHERTMEMDVLLLWVRRMLIYDPDLRVILMSATMDKRPFENYFKHACFVDASEVDVKCIEILTKPYEIRHKWLDNVVQPNDEVFKAVE